MSNKHTPGPWTVYGPKKLRPQFKTVVIEIQAGGVAVVPWVGLDAASQSKTEKLANARLIAAAPDLLDALTMGQSMNTPDFMDWLADRLVLVYQENKDSDFIQSLRKRAQAARAAIAKATGQ